MKHNIFMVGGSKGVGKTRLTLDVATLSGLERIETGKIVLNYVLQNLPLEGLTNYLVQEIISMKEDLILDTHYARYSDKEEPNKQFRRGLEKEDLAKLLGKFTVFPCLIEVPLDELEKRRRMDEKKRIVTPSFILEEIEFNRRGYELYLAEVKKKPFILINNVYETARDNLLGWIVQNSGKK